MDNLNKLIDLTRGANNSLLEFDNRVQVTSENARRTIFLADLPRSTSYIDLIDYFETKVGPCTIDIKR